ncbi:MFS general substrate transporter [Annulohypoxylon maeteangense]|uniref:MFS general substrate transporter n=1 Tax=Annulohypoxylon maeteangense TaxID=1927788 RepID=UPI0020071E25|nr:MFS general substrate transporter [Annulohypoxylon maeteangense]KAI0884696.1 MFS general substrate transporter [Annulohypoxylon maeteangense]
MLIDIAAKRVSAKTRLCIHERHKLRQEHQDAAQMNVTTTITAGESTDPIYRSKNCPQCKAEEKAANKYRWKLILCLILPYALQALDVTIVASALPWIAADFGEIAQLNWIISAFNLTSAAFIPFWAQMADIFGRHWALQLSSLTMLIGSAICTAVPTTAFGAFLLGRALQGIACAGLNTIIRAIMADKVSLKENARNWTLFAFTGGMCYGIGPVIGGYLTAANWRWCFGINLPIAFLGVLIVFFFLRRDLLGPQPIPELNESEAGRRERFARRLATIDIGGQLLFLFGFGLIILALTWAGATYDWDDAAVLVPIIVGVLLACAWLYYEYSMSVGVLSHKLSFQRPMLPWNVVKNRNVSLLCYINFATGMAMYSVLYFVDIYFTIVKGFLSDKAGVQLLFYTPGLGVGVYLSMVLCNIWPRQTFWPLLIGSVIEAVGVGMMAWALYFENTATIYGMMALTGAGTGLRFMPGSLHAVGFFPDHIATVISIMGVATTFGGTLALTIMSTVFNNTSGLTSDSPISKNYDALKTLPEEIKLQIVDGVRKGITWAFVSLTPFMVICVVASLCLGNVTISKEDNAEESGHHLTHGSYLLALIKGKGHREENVNLEMGERGSSEPLRYQDRFD